MPPSRERWTPIAAWALITAGAGARIAAWSARDLLWHDEAALALSIVHRGFGGLLEPLELSQIAPVGFLWLVEAVTRLFGTSDHALRLVPMLAGVATPALFWVAARRWIGGWCAVLALVIVSCSHYAIFFASEFKPYAVDAMAAAGALAALAWRDRPRGFTLASWTIGGGVAVWISHPACFVLAGAGLAILWNARRDGPRGLAAPAAMIVAWIASFGVHSWIQSDENRFMAEFWRGIGGFVPRSTAALPWTRDRIVELFSNPVGIHFGVAGLIAALVGVVVLVLERRSATALALVTPILAALAASAIERYPFAARLMLFVLPSLAMLIGIGAAALARTRTPGGVAGAAVIAAIILQPMLTTAALLVVHGREPQRLRPLLESLARESSDADALISSELASPVVELYADRYGLVLERRSLPYQAGLDDARRVAGESMGSPRVFVLATPHLDEPALVELGRILGPWASEVRAGESWLRRFDRR